MEISFYQGKDTFDAFSSLICRKSKGITVLYVMGMICIAVNALLTAAGAGGPFLLGAGLFFCIWAAMRERSYGDALFKAAPRYMVNQQVTWRFEPEYFCFFSPLCNATYRYETVGRIMENDRVIALYVGEQTALILDKRGLLPGQAEQLAALLTSHTGRPIERVSDKKRRTALIAAAVAAAVVLTAAGYFGGMVVRDRIPRTLSNSEYSIRVVQGFEGRSSDYYDLAADWEEKRTYLAVTWYPSDYALSQREMLRYYADGAEGMEWSVLSDGSPALIFDWEDGYRYFVTAEAGSDGWWITEFSCPAGRAEEMLPRFAGWAETVTAE